MKLFLFQIMVRPISAVWTHFISYHYNNKKRAKCKYCNKQYLVPNATKMAKHLEVCRRKPMIVSVPIFPSAEEDTDDPSAIIGSEEVLVNSGSIGISQDYSFISRK